MNVKMNMNLDILLYNSCSFDMHGLSIAKKSHSLIPGSIAIFGVALIPRELCLAVALLPLCSYHCSDVARQE